MTTNRSQLYWGLVLLLLGGLFLAVNLHMIPEPGGNLWALIFAGISALCLVGYFVGGVRNWGWLFPATVTGAIAATIWMAEAGVDGTLIGSMFMTAVSLPFWVAFVTAPRTNWWGLIPGWVLLAIAGIIFAADRLPGEVMAALIMFAIGLPFLVVYFARRTQWWALIPGGITCGIGVMLLFASVLRGELLAAVIMLGIAVPFFALFLIDRQHWWALIPGGIMATIALTLVVSALPIGESLLPNVMGAIMFGGTGLIFAALWLRRAQYQTDWAKYPAAILCAIGLVILVAGPQTNVILSLALVLVGAWLLYRAWRKPPELR